MTLLDVIQAEREALLAPIADKLAALEAIERLALEAGYGPDAAPEAEPEPSTPPAVPAPRRAAVRERRTVPIPSRDEMAVRYAKVLEAVRACQPASAVVVRDHAGLSSDQVQYTLRVAIDRSAIVKEGRGRDAHYWITADRDRLEAETNGAHTRHNPTREMQAGSIRWRVLAAVGDRTGMSEGEIADGIRVSRELVAEATGALLEDGSITLRPDGTYAVAPSG